MVCVEKVKFLLLRECRLMDLSLCYKNDDLSNEILDSCAVPKIYGFSFLTLLANSTFVRFHFDAKVDFDFEMKSFKVNSAGSDVRKSTASDFS